MSIFLIKGHAPLRKRSTFSHATNLEDDATNGRDGWGGLGRRDQHDDGDWNTWSVEHVTPPRAVILWELDILNLKVVLPPGSVPDQTDPTAHDMADLGQGV